MPSVFSTALQTALLFSSALLLIIFVAYLQAFSEHDVIQMALVAFYRQLLGILCPSVFVLSLSFYWLFYISLCSALFLSLPISNILPEHCPSVLEIIVILCSLFVFGRLFNCGHHHCWIVVFSCGSYMHTAGKISWFNFSNITNNYWTLLSGWATCWRVVCGCECFTHPRVSI